MLDRHDHGADQAPFQRLTAREDQVLEMVSLGLTNHELAARLEVSVHAVKFHLAAIYRKLGVANRTQAAAMYLRGGGAPASGVPTASGGDAG